MRVLTNAQHRGVCAGSNGHPVTPVGRLTGRHCREVSPSAHTSPKYRHTSPAGRQPCSRLLHPPNTNIVGPGASESGPGGPATQPHTFKQTLTDAHPPSHPPICTLTHTVKIRQEAEMTSYPRLWGVRVAFDRYAMPTAFEWYAPRGKAAAAWFCVDPSPAVGAGGVGVCIHATWPFRAAGPSPCGGSGCQQNVTGGHPVGRAYPQPRCIQAIA